MSGISNLRKAFNDNPDGVIKALNERSAGSFGRFGSKKVSIQLGEGKWDIPIEVSMSQLRKLASKDKKLTSTVNNLEAKFVKDRADTDRGTLPSITQRSLKIREKIRHLANKIKPRREVHVEAPNVVEQEKAENTVGLALKLLSPHFKELRSFGFKANDITALIIAAGTAHGGADEAAQLDKTFKLLNVDDQAQVADILEKAIKAIKDQPELTRLSMFLGILKQHLSEE